MRPTLVSARYEQGVRLYFTYIGVATLAYAVLVLTHMAREWLLAEWLINYEGGFVRRGLPGELAYLLGRLTHVPPTVFVIACCVLLYGVLLLCLLSLFLRAPRSYWVYALLLSPATLSFQILDPLAGFHKEIIDLAALSLFVILLREKRLSRVGVVGYLATAFPIMTLSHEPLVCFLPFFLGALLLAGRSLREACTLCLLPFALGTGVDFLCMQHLGDAAEAGRICASLGYPYLPDTDGNQVCAGGAIGYLSNTAADAWAKVRTDIPHYHYLPVYALLTMLSLAPAVAGSLALRQRGMRQQMRVLWGTAAVAFTTSLILFIYSVDWGRWIYVHTLSVTILLLYCSAATTQASAASAASAEKTRPMSLAAGALLLLYSTTWTLPHFNQDTPHFGYLSMARFVVSLPSRYAHRRAAPGVRAQPD